MTVYKVTFLLTQKVSINGKKIPSRSRKTLTFGCLVLCCYREVKVMRSSNAAAAARVALLASAVVIAAAVR